MKKTLKFLWFFLILFLVFAAFYWYHEEPKDVLVSIENGEDIVKAKQNSEIKQGIDNLNLSTDYDDKRRAIEFLDFCYALSDIESFQSDEFIELANAKELNAYLLENEIFEPKQCINWQSLTKDGLKKECTFNGDNGLQTPYISLYSLGKMSSERFNKSMEVIAWFYKPYYPSNSYILLALHDKNTGVFTDKSYCEQVVTDNYDDFRRRKEGNDHVYTKTEEDLIAEEEQNTQVNESNIK